MVRFRSTSQALTGPPAGRSKRAAYFPCATTSSTMFTVPRTAEPPTGPVLAHWAPQVHWEMSPVSKLPEKTTFPTEDVGSVPTRDVHESWPHRSSTDVRTSVVSEA